MAGLDFVHLHVHSNYSLLEGAIPLARLADLTKADKQAALALTDTDNMFGGLEFSEKMAGAGIQPIVGCALAVDFGDTENGARNANAATPRERIVLLAAREAGYRSLMRLNSRAFLETPSNEAPHAKLSWLDGETGGLIALTGGPGGPLDTAIAAGQGGLAAARADVLIGLFGDRLYVELQRQGVAHRVTEPALIDIAYAKGLPLVATNEAFFAKAEDYEAHDALICIAEGKLIADVRLEIAGLMTARPAEAFDDEMQAFYRAAAAVEWMYQPSALNLWKPGFPEFLKFATLTCSPWRWVLVAPSKAAPEGFVNVQTGETHKVVWA